MLDLIFKNKFTLFKIYFTHYGANISPTPHIKINILRCNTAPVIHKRITFYFLQVSTFCITDEKSSMFGMFCDYLRFISLNLISLRRGLRRHIFLCTYYKIVFKHLTKKCILFVFYGNNVDIIRKTVFGKCAF